ncbi:MAG: nucleotidyltransferase family protein [Deinococcota bacterium]|nr:nucleotidyltransferase family protein [Deinococcota bacterium]
MEPPRDDPYRQLERFLLEPAHALPDLDILRAHDLAAYAYTCLEPQHPAKDLLELDFALASARHLAAKADLLPLVRAWRRVGIEVLVFKGFYLAEFAYELPGQRHYYDVDLLMAPERALEASAIAQALGWLERWHIDRAVTIHSYRPADYDRHEVMHLDNASGGLRLDVHRRILHNKLPWTKVQARFTRHAWSASEELVWEDTAVRVLQPADSLLIGLVLNRFWGREDWHLKGSDFLDFGALIRRRGLTHDALLQRAGELRCRRSLAIFLARCDAFGRRLELRPPTQRQRRRWNLAILAERGHPGLERKLVATMRRPGTLLDTLRELPGVLRVLNKLRQQRVKALVEGIEEPVVSPELGPVSFDAWQGIKRGVDRSLRLLGVELSADCPPRTLALFFALRRRGCPVTLRSEVRQGESEHDLHLWLELDGKVLYEMNEQL